MIDELDRLVDEITSLNSKLVLLVGPPAAGKSGLLSELSERRATPVLNVGVALGAKLLAIPGPRRHLEAADMLKDMLDEAAGRDIVLLDNIELLFDRTLQLDPLDLLKRHAHACPLIAVWPGELREDRLCYAATGHTEHQDYGIDRLVTFAIR